MLGTIGRKAATAAASAVCVCTVGVAGLDLRQPVGCFWATAPSKPKLPAATNPAAAVPPLSSVAYQGGAHRPYNAADAGAIRTMKGLPARRNPGVRVEQLLDLGSCRSAAAVEKELIAEVEALAAEHGCNHIVAEHRAVYDAQLRHLPIEFRPTPNMQRVTGRSERPEQSIAPWGYGDTFRESEVPPALGKLLRRVQRLEGFDLGAARDITLNLRRESFFRRRPPPGHCCHCCRYMSLCCTPSPLMAVFQCEQGEGVSVLRSSSRLRLDPHVDPISDGQNVVIVSLGSGTVLSLSPVRLQLSARRDEAQIATRSWTDADLDIRVDRGHCVLLTADARYRLRHGTRTGVPAAGASTGRDGKRLLADWWGLPAELLPREESRWSVVFAFAAGQGQVAARAETGLEPAAGG